MNQDKKKQIHNNESQQMERIDDSCLTFTSHELFWKELETIVDDGVEMAEE